MKLAKLAAIVGLAIITAFVPQGFAAFTTTNHTVTVEVPEVLSLSADTSSFTLTFNEWAAGSETDSKTVVYTVQANDMGQADGQPAINIDLDFSYDRVELQALAGSFSRLSGNTDLVPAAGSNFIPVGEDITAVANKGNTDSGSDGKLLHGTLPITYKAVATGDVPSGPQTHVMYVTLTTR